MIVDPLTDVAYPHSEPAESVAPRMGLTPLENNYGLTMVMGLTSTQSPAEFIAPLMGLTPTQTQLRSHSIDRSHPHSESRV